MQFERLNILLVDDNHHMRMLLAEILRAMGVLQVFEAPDGAEALKILRARKIDIVMTDLEMQPLDGLDFVRKLRNGPDSPSPTTPVIMITGHFTPRRVAEARDAGVNEFLSKPVTARGVLDRLTRVVETPRPFVRSADYFGPDRRRQASPNYNGPRRRAADRAGAGQSYDLD